MVFRGWIRVPHELQEFPEGKHNNNPKSQKSGRIKSLILLKDNKETYSSDRIPCSGD
jgi:hypothetical protein